MASINPETAWEFADAIKSVLKLPTTRRRATVQNVDKDGTIWVQLPGSSNVTPIASTGANVAPGDTVLTELRGTSLHITENNSDPAVGTRQAGDIARQAAKPAVDAAKAAQEIAVEAEAVANATNQHFWDDDNGAHVTDVTQDEWTAAAADDFSDLSDAKPYHNLLMNSLGILLRRALNNLVSISKSAIAFYDGTGNAAANIVARFGSAGAQIGLTDESHMTLDYHSMQMVDKEGNTYFHVSDLRDMSGTATITEVKRGDGETTSFSVVFRVYELVSAIDSSDETNHAHGSGYQVVFENPPASDAVVTIVYKTKDSSVKAYTLGTRAAGSTIGAMSYAEGINITASSYYTHAEGRSTIASAPTSHAEGKECVASGIQSHAEGCLTEASGTSSHSEGFGTKAQGENSHAEGNVTHATGKNSHAEGYFCQAQGENSHAEGTSTHALGKNSHVQNTGTFTNADDQTALGRYNAYATKYAVMVGNGNGETTRSNALAVRWNGLTDVAGRTAYPLFVYSTAPDEADLPVTPCFVLVTSDYTLLYYDGQTVNTVPGSKLVMQSGNTKVYASGKVVTVAYDATIAHKNTWTYLTGVIPAEYRPPTTLYNIGFDTGNRVARTLVNSGGQIGGYATVDNARVYGLITYMVM